MLAVFGDSIAAGLGARGASYAARVANACRFDLLDFSDSAMRIDESLDLLSGTDARPTHAIVAHGITEAIVRPSDRLLRLMPPRWRRPGWMDPRPYYSSRFHKRLGQKFESAVRWRLKIILIGIESSQMMEIDEYERAMSRLCRALRDRGTQVLVLGPPAIDDTYFPRSEAAQIRFERSAADVAKETGCEFLALRDICSRWGDFAEDRFHLNDAGHRRVAEVIMAHWGPAAEAHRRK